MKITYDPKVDVLRIPFSNTPIEESDEDNPGIIIDMIKMVMWWAWKLWTPLNACITPGRWIMRWWGEAK
jgi:hypothetical protein